ncbi:MAG: HAD family hydrolase [Methylococcaceae bacterium]|nr:HAD family hydrolase [Methylococcaceae bacterium]
MTDFKLECVLFDLDGTLVDTAPDLLASLNRTLLAFGFLPAEEEALRPFISHGALAMINQSRVSDSDELKAQMLDYMLDSYQNHIADSSELFAGMAEVLQLIEAKGLKWGVVTNKRERFTNPLLAALQLDSRAACAVSGDTTAFSKPHPEPMFEACRRASVSPANCVYIGDAVHDITAGKQADMKALVAMYGYLKPDDQPEHWGADALISHPSHLMHWIESATCL